MRFIIPFLLFPLLAIGQSTFVRTHCSIESDTVFSKSGNWLVYSISESYADASPENPEDAILFTRSAVLLFTVGAKKPLLIESTLLLDTTETQILQRLKRLPKIEKPSVKNDTLDQGEESETVQITHLANDIFEISVSNWQYYPGAAHGAGSSSVTYFSANTAKFFGFEDVFKGDIYPFIQKKLKENIRAEFLNWEFNEAEVDSIAAENYAIGADNYSFVNDGLLIQCQMYCNFYGWVYMGYSYYSFTIPWLELQPFMQPKNPLSDWLED